MVVYLVNSFYLSFYMRKINFLFLLVTLLAIAGTNFSYGLSIHKSLIDTNRNYALKCVSLKEFVKLSEKQLSVLTGKKINMWEKILFAIAKSRVKHDLKMHPDGQLKKPSFFKRNSPFQRVLFWILIGLFAFLLLFILIFGLAPG